ncbi:MAG: T9SS type A sorting domain-containing protein, partial [Catalinimonas sp.]
QELWRYDGTGTPAPVTDIDYWMGSVGGINHVYNGALYFPANLGTVAEELYRYDGTALTLAANVNDGNANSAPSELIEYQDRVYFNATGANGRELYVYDGTQVSEVADLYPGENPAWQYPQFSSSPQRFFTFDGRLFCSARDSAGTHIWQYDGNGTPTRSTALPGGGSDFLTWGDDLYYVAFDTTYGSELRRWDGTNAPALVADIAAGKPSSGARNLFVWNDQLYFLADGGTGEGRELWTYDGTNAPTQVQDLSVGAGGIWMSGATPFQGQLYLQAYADTIHATELYRYDGDSIRLVADLFPGRDDRGRANSSNPLHLTAVGDTLYFVAQDSSGSALWKYDGQNPPAVAVRADMFYNNVNYSVQRVDSLLYFWADPGTGVGRELHHYNTQTGALTLVAELRPGPAGSRPQNTSQFLVRDGYLYLSATDGVLGDELYRVPVGERVTGTPAFDEARRALRVYPNPTSDQFRVERPAREVAGARLIDAAGRTVRRYAGGQNQFSVQGVRPGFYFLQLKSADRLQTTKVIVR